jgi:hypothetical protein
MLKHQRERHWAYFPMISLLKAPIFESRSQEDWTAVQASGSRDEKKEGDETAKEDAWV